MAVGLQLQTAARYVFTGKTRATLHNSVMRCERVKAYVLDAAATLAAAINARRTWRQRKMDLF
jgi:hypothetical protein